MASITKRFDFLLPPAVTCRGAEDEDVGFALLVGEVSLAGLVMEAGRALID